MLKKIAVALVAGVLTIGGVGVANATAKELPEGSMVRPYDIRKCAGSGVERDDRGHCVWILQIALDRQGYKLETDGRYGPNTQRKVLAFNRDKCVGHDGKGNFANRATRATFEALADNLQPFQGVQKHNSSFYANHG